MTTAFIINRDRFHTTKEMVEYLQQIPEIQVVVIDNDSAYPPLLDWYDTNPCIVERLTANYGNFVVWSLPTAIEGHIKPNFIEKYTNGNHYIVTDSDLDLSAVPLNFLAVMKDGLIKFPWACKIGLSLEINDLPNTEIAKEALGWETLNWSLDNFISPPYRRCPVDTTFAIVNSVGDPNDFDRCLRLDRPYTARHRPWYYTKENIPEDEKFYVGRVTSAFNHYSIRLKNQFGL